MNTNRITGAAKIFDKSFTLLKDGATASASSNDDAINYILTPYKYTQWESVGSDDTITETITINFDSEKEIDSIFLANFNFKEFAIQYNDGLGLADFSNVYGVNGVQSSSISETDYSYGSAFYQFDTVSTSQIVITCLKTQVADAQKFLGQAIATLEVGTFQGFPRITPESDRNETTAKTLSRKIIAQKTYETSKIKINFKTHPYQNDADIIQAIFDREEPFLIYPCGGRTGTSYFKIEQNNWRLQDVYNVQLTGKIKNEYEKGVYLLGFKKSITLEEHV